MIERLGNVKGILKLYIILLIPSWQA